MFCFAAAALCFCLRCCGRYWGVGNRSNGSGAPSVDRSHLKASLAGAFGLRGWPCLILFGWHPQNRKDAQPASASVTTPPSDTHAPAPPHHSKPPSTTKQPQQQWRAWVSASTRLSRARSRRSVSGCDSVDRSGLGWGRSVGRDVLPWLMRHPPPPQTHNSCRRPGRPSARAWARPGRRSRRGRSRRATACRRGCTARRRRASRACTASR